MKINLEKITLYNKVLNKIGTTNLPVKVAYKVYLSQYNLIPHVEYYSQEIKRIYDDCLQKEENGEYVFSDDSGFLIAEGKQAELIEKLNELNSLEVEFETSTLPSVDDLIDTNVTMSASEIAVICEVTGNK